MVLNHHFCWFTAPEFFWGPLPGRRAHRANTAEADLFEIPEQLREVHGMKPLKDFTIEIGWFQPIWNKKSWFIVIYSDLYHGIYSDLMGYEWDLASGKHTKNLLKMAIEIVSFPIKHGDLT